MSERGDHVADELVGFALGTLDGPGAAGVRAHLAACASCRRELEELAAAIDDVVGAAPEVEPPVGFESRALGRMAVPVGGVTPGGGRRRRRNVAAAAALLLFAAAGVALLTLGGDGARSRTAALVTEDGRSVGTVTVDDVGGRPAVVVAVVDAPEGAAYTCRVAMADGRVVAVGPWRPQRGTGAWVVPLEQSQPADVASVELVATGTGDTWSAATL
jgi:hypothetical protein